MGLPAKRAAHSLRVLEVGGFRSSSRPFSSTRGIRRCRRMGRKRNRNKGGGGDGEAGGSGGEGGGGGGGGGGNDGSNWGGEHLQQAAIPLIAAHPDGDAVAVAYGTNLKVYCTKCVWRRALRQRALPTHAPTHYFIFFLIFLRASRAESNVCIREAEPLPHPPLNPSRSCPFGQRRTAGLVELKAAASVEATSTVADGAWHAEAIRGVSFDPTGRFLVTAGDDKLLRLWRRSTAQTSSATHYECFKCVKAQKKLCAVSFTDDGEHVMFANKYGDVHVLPTAASSAAGGKDADGGDWEKTHHPSRHHTRNDITFKCQLATRTSIFFFVNDRQAQRHFRCVSIHIPATNASHPVFCCHPRRVFATRVSVTCDREPRPVCCTTYDDHGAALSQPQRLVWCEPFFPFFSFSSRRTCTRVRAPWLKATR